MSSLDASLAPPPLPAESALGRWSSWSDRLNPILVREVQQAVKGRMFAAAILVALGVTVMIAVYIASNHDPNGNSGQGAFEAGLATLVPLALFVVPMQAYQSMRLELRSGIVEQLLLSRLRPVQILSGKLQAALVQFVLFVAVVAPTLATSYLLRGVDLPTIATSLALAGLACIAATMLAVSSAAQSRNAATQALANIGTAFGLGVGTFSVVGLVLSGEFTNGLAALLRSGEFWRVASGVVVVVGYGSLLAALSARAFLLHAFENKATPFRVALFAAPLLGCVWATLAFWRMGAAPVIAALCYGLLLLSLAFGLFFVTEQRELSPRVRAHVPATSLLALLTAPLLPGRDRGLLCFLLFVVINSVVAMLAVNAIGAGAWGGSWNSFRDIYCFTAGYGCIYLGIGRALRQRLPNTLGGNHAGRILLPMCVMAFMLVPVLIDVFVHGAPRQWHWGHVMNPFWTITHFERWTGSGAGPSPTGVPLVFLLMVVGMVLLQLPACLHGVREVLAASAARRQRQLPVVAPPSPSPSA